MKDQVLARIQDVYGVDPAYLFRSNPHTAVFRLPQNGKWFAVLIGNLPACKLGLKGEERVDILNVKCDPDMAFSIVDHKRIFPAYHMNKLHWISILLDGATPVEEIAFLVAASHRLVSQ
ncbi:MAG: MmcQ/YjbR family DNA-binding protein [Clostridia bacterium]|nr:MmcQ/YjbR family DNA-binding protein [Clostridia bacterium]